MGDKANIVSGPANFTLGAASLGYTQGGISFSYTPKFRARMVDEFGENELDMIHTGDEVRVTVPLVEWSPAVLAAVFPVGNDMTTDLATPYMGFGSKAGAIYAEQAAAIVPIQAGDVAKKITLNRAVPIGQFQLSFTHESDRVFNVQYACLADPGTDIAPTTDGELIGKLELPMP